MSRRAVIFDLDGLLLDTERVCHRVWQDAASEFEYDLTDERFHALIGLKLDDARRRLCEFFGPDFPIDAFMGRCRQRWTERAAAEGIPVKPGVHATLELLVQLDAPFAIGTSSERDLAEANLRAAGIRDAFGIVVSGCDVANGKPAPDIYLEAARRLAVTPADCLVFEDSRPGLRAARAAGMRAVHVPDLIPPDDEARSLAHARLASLEEAETEIRAWFGGSSVATPAR